MPLPLFLAALVAAVLALSAIGVRAFRQRTID
jgi:hypothetical protein